jgi:hypothetical protein
LKTRSGAERVPRVELDGTLYLNPARVPRIRGGRDGVQRSHVRLEIDADGVRASELFVDSDR